MRDLAVGSGRPTEAPLGRTRRIRCRRFVGRSALYRRGAAGVVCRCRVGSCAAGRNRNAPGGAGDVRTAARVRGVGGGRARQVGVLRAACDLRVRARRGLRRRSGRAGAHVARWRDGSVHERAGGSALAPRPVAGRHVGSRAGARADRGRGRDRRAIRAGAGARRRADDRRVGGQAGAGGAAAAAGPFARAAGGCEHGVERDRQRGFLRRRLVGRCNGRRGGPHGRLRRDRGRLPAGCRDTAAAAPRRTAAAPRGASRRAARRRGARGFPGGARGAAARARGRRAVCHDAGRGSDRCPGRRSGAGRA